jgi:potassium-transporting ATPase ATP-binding subunit
LQGKSDGRIVVADPTGGPVWILRAQSCNSTAVDSEIVEIGGCCRHATPLTTFSIANDVAKYFAIIPAMFLAFYPQLGALNIMNLSTPQRAILSAIIFNALIIIALIPLALKGVAYRPIGAGPLLRRNLLIYGGGGVIVPFIGIKAIDLAVTALHLA